MSILFPPFLGLTSIPRENPAAFNFPPREQLDFEGSRLFTLQAGPSLGRREIRLEGGPWNLHFEMELSSTPGPTYINWSIPGHSSFMGQLNGPQSDVLYNTNLLVDQGLWAFVRHCQSHLPDGLALGTEEASSSSGHELERSGLNWLSKMHRQLGRALGPRLFLKVDLNAAQGPCLELELAGLSVLADFHSGKALQIRIFVPPNLSRAYFDVRFELYAHEAFQLLEEVLGSLGKKAKYPISLVGLAPYADSLVI